MIAILKEYCKESSLHGLLPIVLDENSRLERVLWGCIFSFTAVSFILHTSSLASLISHSPVEMIVDNPFYDLKNVEFPAVTVCSNSKVMRRHLMRHIEMLQLSPKDSDNYVNTILAMDLLRYPFYYLPEAFVNRTVNGSVFPIPQEDITDVMGKVRPKIADMFKNCKWNGQPRKCRLLFRQQITEEGFCHSFNSKSAERHRYDPPTLPPTALPDGTLECLRNNIAGRGTGLYFELSYLGNELFSRHAATKGYSFDTAHDDYNTEALSVCFRLAKIPEKLTCMVVNYPIGLVTQERVIIHNPNSFPDTSHKYNIFFKNYSYSRFSVAVMNVKADVSLSMISDVSRGCELKSSNKYNSCHWDCRQREILRYCGCLPYFMYNNNNQADVCGVEQMMCLNLNNIKFRNPFSPEDSNDGIGIPKWSVPEVMNCSCSFECNQTTYWAYNLNIPREEEDGVLGFTQALATVEVSYETPFATSYIKKASFTIEDFIVGVGGGGGLLLSCSVISFVEIIILAYKLTKEAYFQLVIKNNVIHPFID